jgi:Domain of unknown function (DUF4124)
MAFTSNSLCRAALTLMTLCVFAAPPVLAETYKWVDEKGITHYSDTLPPDYSKNANSRIDKRGIVTKKTDRALTEAETKAREDEIKRLKQEEIRAKEQKRLDEIMLATYANETEIDLSRNRSLEPFDGKIFAARERIKYVQQTLAELTTKIAGYKEATQADPKKKPPSRILKDIDSKKTEIAELEQSIKLLEADKSATVNKFSLDKQRFREIAAAGGAGRRLGDQANKDKIPTWVEVRSDLARTCLEQWQDTLGGRAYAVFAEIKRDGQTADLILETRVRRKTGEFTNVKASCPMRADGTFDKEGIRIKRTRYETGKDY